MESEEVESSWCSCYVKNPSQTHIDSIFSLGKGGRGEGPPTRKFVKELFQHCFFVFVQQRIAGIS